MSSGNKYHREIKGCIDKSKAVVDVYSVLSAFEVSHPGIQHAAKKLLCAGIRGKANYLQDLTEARDALDRAIFDANTWETADVLEDLISSLTPSINSVKPQTNAESDQSMPKVSKDTREESKDYRLISNISDFCANLSPYGVDVVTSVLQALSDQWSGMYVSSGKSTSFLSISSTPQAFWEDMGIFLPGEGELASSHVNTSTLPSVDFEKIYQFSEVIKGHQFKIP